MSWNHSTLGELCDTYGGKIQTGPFGSQLHQSDYVNDGIPVVMPKDINQQGIDLSSIARVDEATAQRLARHKLHVDEIVFPRRGEITKCALIRAHEEGFLCGTGCLKITIPTKVLHPRFFRYYLAKQEIIEWLDGNAVGATMKNLSTGILEKLPVSLPPLPSQRKIAAILSGYDDLIENNLKRIKLLEEMAQITYEDWFVRLRFPGHDSTPINPVTNLPEGWEIKTISTVCDVNKNTIIARTAPKTIRYIDISSAETSSYATPQEMAFSDAPSRARRRVAFGDTIFSTVRPNRRVFSLVLENDPLLVASTGFAVLTPHRAQNYPFIYLTIAQKSFTDAAVAVAGGAAYPAVNQTDFERIKITVPTQELMNKFSDMFVPNFAVKGQLLQENTLLREARDILLPRLMTGMIDVESYDPAQLLKEAA